ncbi:MAG: ChbG/HpnK family deacetylase [Rhodoferax sp.]|uniref:ChbG/HpnK family deacetylase n=1 Tax=Rhodoferax sp. TaxID=50421 RepID=UPI00261D582F|nr:ChbG/HpnK family deacetylase [Rhodoferax sp.]MDD2881167.1 ChbG/HpnK family deacetylase [Rhodoferax sp.]
MVETGQVAAGKDADVRGIIVCADDFAVNASASMGIAKLAQLGRLSATSAMVLSPRWAQDVALLQGLRGQIDVGLHLDWTSAFAIAAGHGMPLGRAMRRALLGGFDEARAHDVIDHQLDLFEAQWQAPPDFVDGHQHVQQFAGIRDALVAVLLRRYGTQGTKPYLRISRAPPGMADLKSRVIAGMGANALESIAACAYLISSRGLFGIYNFEGGPQRYAALMTGWLARAPAGAILMCHPAQAAEPDDEIGVARVQEFAYLASSAFADALQQAHVTVLRGRDALVQAT